MPTRCLRPRHLLQAKLVCFLVILGVGGFGSAVAGSTIVFRQHYSPDRLSGWLKWDVLSAWN